jgi:hypothetical protein
VFHYDKKRNYSKINLPLRGKPDLCHIQRGEGGPRRWEARRGRRHGGGRGVGERGGERGREG